MTGTTKTRMSPTWRSGWTTPVGTCCALTTGGSRNWAPPTWSMRLAATWVRSSGQGDPRMTSHLDDAVQAFGEAIGKLLSVSTIAVIVQPDLATAARSLIEDPNCSEDADWIPAIAAAAVKLLAVMQSEGVDAQEISLQVNNLLPDQMPPRSRPVSRRPKGVLMERKPFQWGASKRRTPELNAGLRKLNRAFGLMRDRGLVAEQNFMCCSSCGQRVMDEEMLPNHPDATGYCFYDSQSADTLVGRPSGLSDAVDLEGVGVVWLPYGAAHEHGR